MEQCPCGHQHWVAADVAASVRAAVGRGFSVTYDTTTGEHRWFPGEAPSPARPEIREEVNVSDETQPVPEAPAEADQTQADQATEEEAQQPVAPLRKPLPPYAGLSNNGEIVHQY